LADGLGRRVGRQPDTAKLKAVGTIRHALRRLVSDEYLYCTAIAACVMSKMSRYSRKHWISSNIYTVHYFSRFLAHQMQ
jgi:hypothetical protein